MKISTPCSTKFLIWTHFDQISGYLPIPANGIIIRPDSCKPILIVLRKSWLFSQNMKKSWLLKMKIVYFFDFWKKIKNNFDNISEFRSDSTLHYPAPTIAPPEVRKVDKILTFYFCFLINTPFEKYFWIFYVIFNET